ncbi:MAG: catechol 2,3-dioxygenase [Chloroflexota bacterium]|jgi:catechol 2,3-dioxygenase|nr:catechol 2,3-dioxygenase [Chloroflexota bacterium]
MTSMNIDAQPTQATSQAEPFSIAPETGVGAVHLAVTDGPAMLEFYRDVVGLTDLGPREGLVRLGAGGRELVVLHPDATGPVVQQRTGLYHLALLVPDRRELARVVARLFAMRYPHSPTDHTMTKSDYLWDPDGNGIEVYCESPEDGRFVYSEDTFGAIDNEGRPRSGRDPMDLDELFGHLTDADDLQQPMPEATRMGHVHLHIRDVPEALGFYHDLMGFDVMGLMRRFGAAFISAGGYHHHLGLNTWAGQGAPPPPPGTAGLRHFTMELPSAGDLDTVVARLRGGGIDVQEDGAGLWASDPSSNRLLLKVRDGA